MGTAIAAGATVRPAPGAGVGPGGAGTPRLRPLLLYACRAASPPDPPQPYRGIGLSAAGANGSPAGSLAGAVATPYGVWDAACGSGGVRGVAHRGRHSRLWTRHD